MIDPEQLKRWQAICDAANKLNDIDLRYIESWHKTSEEAFAAMPMLIACVEELQRKLEIARNGFDAILDHISEKCLQGSGNIDNMCNELLEKLK